MTVNGCHTRRSGTARPMYSAPAISHLNGSGSPRCEEENGGEERYHKTAQPDAPVSLDAESDRSRRRKPALVRSRTLDQSLLSQIQSDGELKTERKKPQSSQFSRFSNSQYHKIFKDISEDEPLRQSYTCALQKDILYQGRLFVSDNWVCFHSKVFGKDTKIAVPVPSITMIKKTKTAILVPNALVIETANERHVFVSFLSRDNTYKFLMSVCFHLDEKAGGSYPNPTSFRSDPASLPLHFSSGLLDLAGALRQGQHIEDSSSSDSQPAEYVKIPGFPDLPLSKPPKKDKKKKKGSSVQAHVENGMKQLRPASLNTLLAVYLFLVIVLIMSSCCMAFKIVSLEQKLTSLGSLSDLSYSGNVPWDKNVENPEVYSVLSVNLLMLEKIQRNLQRLLEQTQG